LNFIGQGNALIVELTAAMLAIEIVVEKNWSTLWLEKDSQPMVLAFKSISVVPWKVRNRWLNCLNACRSMNFTVTHIFREGNHYADRLASIGFNSHKFIWWNDVHSEIKEDFARNKLGLPNYRFC